MDGSVYKIIEIVGVSATSWEDATKVAMRDRLTDVERPEDSRGGKTGCDHRVW